MIVPMKKISLLIFYKEYQQFLEELREKGVVHIHENVERSAEDKALQTKLMLIKQAGEMIMRLENRNATDQKEKVDVADDQLLEYLDNSYRRLEQIDQELAYVQKEYAQYRPWGDFSRNRVEGLKKAGWELRFFTVQDQKFDTAWEGLYNAVVVNEMMGQKYFVTVTPVGTKVDLEADPFVFPTESAEKLAGEMERLRKEALTLNQKLDREAEDAIHRLKDYRLHVGEIVDELKVEDAARALVEEKVIALEGWIPAEKEEEMRKFLETKDTYFEFSRPTPEDDVPVLLHNNAYTRLFEPITRMFALPNYNELDPTPFLAPFFMLFFGLCMGDGGYGLLIWAVCFWLGRKAKPELKGYLVLGQILGITTIVVGILTGSFFGIALDSVEWPWLKGVKEYFLTEANYGKYLGGYNPMMVLAVVVGIVQILFGMCISAAKLTKQYGFKYAMSTIAWVVVILMGIVLLGLPALGMTLPLVLTYVLYGIVGICAIVILFMNSPGKGVFTNLGSALWGTYNMATGLLGDTLSYIRLFALGLTGSILGGVFNTLAFELTSSLPFVVQFIAAFLILLIGHSINFGLCMIGAFVHPMRLTFVEFYKNASFEGGGKQYEPFRKKVA